MSDEATCALVAAAPASSADWANIRGLDTKMAAAAKHRLAREAFPPDRGSRPELLCGEVQHSEGSGQHSGAGTGAGVNARRDR